MTSEPTARGDRSPNVCSSVAQNYNIFSGRVNTEEDASNASMLVRVFIGIFSRMIDSPVALVAFTRQ